MERLLDELIGYVWTVKVAGVYVVYAGGNGLAQNSDCTGNIPWWTPNYLCAISTGKLHGAEAHAPDGD
jgi:hypothetical protein